MRAYVHVPFCRQKCGYCKFALTPFVRDSQVSLYFAALKKEIAAFFDAEGTGTGPVETLYFWGGTPSAVPVEKLTEIVALFKERIGFAPDTEITVEANPEDLTPEYCRGLFELGVTRLSVGVQSLDDAVLATVGRKGGETTVAGLKSAFSAGFRNVNADLILGLPDEAPGGTFRALSRLLEEYPLSHASLYVLEEGAYPKGWKGRHADMDGVRAEYDRCRRLLLEKGFVHYEISNFAKPGFESKHNRGYWNRNDVRGFGLSAASLWKGERFENAPSFAGYYRGETVGRETLTPQDVRLEEALCGMRTFSMPKSLVGDVSKVVEFRDLGWIEERDEKILLTSAWIFFLDHIIAGLI